MSKKFTPRAFRKYGYKKFPQDIQEHYLNLKYQFGEYNAQTWLFLEDIKPLMITIAISQMALDITADSLREVGILKEK